MNTTTIINNENSSSYRLEAICAICASLYEHGVYVVYDQI